MPPEQGKGLLELLVQDAQLFLLLTAMLWFTHRANIARLLRGTEPKIGEAAPTAPSQVSQQ